jgi:hypothetical protein
MFRINDAPNEVLAAVSADKVSRGCGIFWSIAMCIPTFGTTIGCCSGNQCGACCDKKANWTACCYPNEVSLESDAALNAFLDALQKIKADKGMKIQISENLTFSTHNYIEWQVKQTLNILEKALKDNKIQGSYKTALERANTTLRTRASQAEEFGVVIDTEKSPLTSTNPYIPSYGLTAKK